MEGRKPAPVPRAMLHQQKVKISFTIKQVAWHLFCPLNGRESLELYRQEKQLGEADGVKEKWWVLKKLSGTILSNFYHFGLFQVALSQVSEAGMHRKIT